MRRKQLDELAAATSAAVCQETLRVLPEVQAVATRAKLPLVDLALPGLRQLSPRPIPAVPRRGAEAGRERRRD